MIIESHHSRLRDNSNCLPLDCIQPPKINISFMPQTLLMYKSYVIRTYYTGIRFLYTIISNNKCVHETLHDSSHSSFFFFVYWLPFLLRSSYLMRTLNTNTFKIGRSILPDYTQGEK